MVCCKNSSGAGLNLSPLKVSYYMWCSTETQQSWASGLEVIQNPAGTDTVTHKKAPYKKGLFRKAHGPGTYGRVIGGLPVGSWSLL